MKMSIDEMPKSVYYSYKNQSDFCNDNLLKSVIKNLPEIQ